VDVQPQQRPLQRRASPARQVVAEVGMAGAGAARMVACSEWAAAGITPVHTQRPCLQAPAATYLMTRNAVQKRRIARCPSRRATG
jgi:hypothetical protein